MTKGKQVLGRGLASLLARPGQQSAAEGTGPGAGSIDQIPLGQIQRNPFQPRADFDAAALDELKRSIQEKGVIQPITVRRAPGGYQLISGERRVRAARDAGLARIPAYIIEIRADEEMLEIALIENLQREELNPVETAISYRRLIEECGYTQEQVSQRIGKDRTTVTNFLRLLKLPDLIQAALRKGELTAGHARAIVALEDPEAQLELFRAIVARQLSVRDAESMVREQARGRKKRRARVAVLTPAGPLTGVEERLRQVLGTKVQVRPLREGRGEITIEYYSADDLDRLLDLFAELQPR